MEDYRIGKRGFKIHPKKFQTELITRRTVRLSEKLVSEHDPLRTTHGLEQVVTLVKGKKMADMLAESSAWLQSQLFSNWRNIEINVPEVFPVDSARCVILVTGYVPEIIALS
jgi:hypothetical protein